MGRFLTLPMEGVMPLRWTSFVWIGFFALAAFGLYMVKFSVQNLQREVAATKQELAREKESLHLLHAEWAYLNRPERLRALAEAHLALVPLDSRRIQNASLIPDAPVEDLSLQGEQGTGEALYNTLPQER